MPKTYVLVLWLCSWFMERDFIPSHFDAEQCHYLLPFPTIPGTRRSFSLNTKENRLLWQKESTCGQKKNMSVHQSLMYIENMNCNIEKYETMRNMKIMYFCHPKYCHTILFWLFLSTPSYPIVMSQLISAICTTYAPWSHSDGICSVFIACSVPLWSTVRTCVHISLLTRRKFFSDFCLYLTFTLFKHSLKIYISRRVTARVTSLIF